MPVSKNSVLWLGLALAAAIVSVVGSVKAGLVTLNFGTEPAQQQAAPRPVKDTACAEAAALGLMEQRPSRDAYRIADPQTGRCVWYAPDGR